MPDIIKVLKDASSLPLGHVGIKEAKKIVDFEYAECRKLEERFLKAWKGIPRCNILGAQRLSNQLCGLFGTSRYPKVFLLEENNEYFRYVKGYHLNGKIFLKKNPHVIVVIHELSHYIVWREKMSGQHNKDFLWVEDTLFSLMFPAGIWVNR